EKQKVARLQVIARDFRRIQRGDRVRRTRQLQAGLAAENIIDQAAAIETGFRRVPAPTVRRSDQADRAYQHIVGDGRGRGGKVRGTNRCKARAGGEQQERGRGQQAGDVPAGVQRGEI